ncbi:FtsB family cell division protein [Demequina soli]|uniref:FtsB family cell division protein n=1 Tax=Demequina soli TaxID=1638987 RepID=UPI00078463B2|nr:septum formation initiator family protein [Demequina soli]
MTSPTRPGEPRRPVAPESGTQAKASAASSAANRARAATRRRPAAASGGARTSGPRASSRPGGATGPGRQAPRPNRIEPARPRGSWVSAMSWRVAVLIGVLVLAAAVVLPSLRAYFRQQEELSALRADAATAQQSVEDLTGEVKRWDDRAYVVAQARERLKYVYPGETPYQVIDPETVEGAAEGSPAAEDPVTADPSGTWYTRLWDSVETAGDAKVGAGRTADSSADPSAEPTPAASSGAGGH